MRRARTVLADYFADLIDAILGDWHLTTTAKRKAITGRIRALGKADR